MHWSDQLVEDLSGPQVVNDSKTPSGRVHVGALRGVLIHDAVYRAATERGLEVRYRYGIDDYDPLDAVPPEEQGRLEGFLGRPLCEVPAPEGSDAGDYAEHHSREFLGIFEELGVHPELYRMRDVYRSGAFNDAIDVILRNADKVRHIDREVSGAERAGDWMPFQAICEACGRVGTTRVTDYDGSVVSYTCAPGLVTWATGCGHTGRVSPFDGGGKLSWKLEWVAKWHEFGVTVEGAGKDHNAPGGSREVAVRCLTEVFGDTPPVNVPYEFFLVGGAKMSSSGGRGVAARDMADLLPPEALRFLVLRPEPTTTVDFRPTQDRLVQVFHDLDRHRERVHAGTATPVERRTYEMSLVDPAAEPTITWTPSFDTVVSIVQMPHLDPAEALAELKDEPLTPDEREEVDRRIRTATHWLEHFAAPGDRLEVCERLPAGVEELSVAQRGFLRLLRSTLAPLSWRPEALQHEIFETARLVPLPQRDAFPAVYRAFLDRDSGPKAGNLLAFLARSDVMGRLAEVPCTAREFVTATAVDEDAVCARITGLSDEVAELVVWTWDAAPGLAAVEVAATTGRGRRYGNRVAVEGEVEPVRRTLVQRLTGATGLPPGSAPSFQPRRAFPGLPGSVD